MTAPFLIYALPRSRTAWLAAFLNYFEYHVVHEHAIHMRSIDDVRAFFAQRCVGAVETAAAPGWRILRHHFPHLRLAVVRRPIGEVVDSYMVTEIPGITYDRAGLEKKMAYGARVLDEISAQPGVLALDYADLDREESVAALWRHCLPYPFDKEWWAEMRHRNVQVSVPDYVLHYHAHREEIDGFKRLAFRELRRLHREGHIAREAAVA